MGCSASRGSKPNRVLPMERKVIECPKCNEPYSEEAKVPMVLACGHSFCDGCIKDMNICHSCQNQILPGTYIRNLALLDTLKRDSHINFIRDDQLEGMDEPDDKTPKFSFICQKYGQEEKIICIRCRKFICETCQQQEHIDHELKIPSSIILTIQKELLSNQNSLQYDPQLKDEKEKYHKLLLQQMGQSKSMSVSLIQALFKQLIDSLRECEASYIKKVEADYDKLQGEAVKRKYVVDGYYQEIQDIDTEIKQLSSKLLSDIIESSNQEIELFDKNDKIKKDIGKAVKHKHVETLTNFSRELSGLNKKFPDVFDESKQAKTLSFESINEIMKLADKTAGLNYLKEAKDLKLQENVSSQRDSLLGIIEKIWKGTSLSSQTVDLLLGNKVL